jgi:hypothetical protein
MEETLIVEVRGKDKMTLIKLLATAEGVISINEVPVTISAGSVREVEIYLIEIKIKK